jgi:hypothetical protein
MEYKSLFIKSLSSRLSRTLLVYSPLWLLLVVCGYVFRALATLASSCIVCYGVMNE